MKLFENRISLKLALGDVSGVANYIIFYKPSQ